MKKSPLTFRILDCGDDDIHNFYENGQSIFEISYHHFDEKEENKIRSEFMIKAVNAHDDLVAALKSVIGSLRSEYLGSADQYEEILKKHGLL